MLSAGIIAHFEALILEKINTTQPLSGGDINDVYLLATNKRKLVVKLNSALGFPKMFDAEAKGLQKLKNTNTFTIPEVLQLGTINENAFLMLEYIDATPPKADFWEVFGEQLAALHQSTASYFGLEENNYIGSLWQYNAKCTSASEFYITQRLKPQFDLALQNGFSFSGINTFYKNISHQIPNEPSSLIHGDLWSGNYMVDKNGNPCLIDPAIAFAPREMDIAMMYLFGGFDVRLFDAYNKVFPLEKDWEGRMPVFQLYYLLVHLNLFGSSYYNGVKNIVNRYS